MTAHDHLSDAGEFRLVSADGARVLAYRAVPRRPTGAGVVVLPDVRGAHEFYRGLARRFAGQGIAALVVDHWARLAWNDDRSDDFDGLSYVSRLDWAAARDDIRAGVDLLLSGSLGPVSTVFALGFSLGGAMALGQAALEPRLRGAIGCYARPAECRELIPRMSGPLLVIGAGDDFFTTVEDNLAFDRELTLAGVEHEFHLYPDAPHSFVDGAIPEQADNAADAWQRVVAFVREHSRES
ncbi:dienelactone hydrolase family protein [Saccharothrix violaceirubra]|uniref:Carboxymethylenebutenolidase n=1 Tax=Saccharothrix violaceirubra TaxID=413306 RepID=A0A7W7T2X2_9PSEU|nr:dienelactone hydrolase family protein [Saccharothrix violaceirubra]MBB4965261.1 carboxymethylenebutenolidase [Saccharothrix violaceirubra]